MQDLMTATQAAQALRVSRMTINRWLKQGQFPNAKLVGNSWLIPRADIDTAALLLAGKTTPTIPHGKP